jgi:hypothetical protein
MAEVQLSRADAQGSRLPAVCMQCGAPATDEVLKKYTTDQVDLTPPPPEPMGCFVWWPILGLLKLLSWSTAKTMTVRMPLCHKHAHGWFTSSTLTAKVITDESIILAGVSDQFVQAWEQRVADRPQDRGSVKVRCRSCQALNDETAKFCDQCGVAM